MNTTVTNSKILYTLTSLCRTDYENVNKSQLIDIMNRTEFPWDRFLSVVNRQKIVGIVYKSLSEMKLLHLVPYRVASAIKYIYLATTKRNQVLMDELITILTAFKEEGIDIRPLKGSVLLDLIYTDYGTRTLNDLDFFVSKNDLKRLPKIMNNLGYIQGEYNVNDKTLTELSREDKLMWKVKMFNLPPFCNIHPEPTVDIISIDFTFGLSFSDKKDINEKILSTDSILNNKKTLSNIDFFIHLCTHLYKEASNEAWENFAQDINLIKFCDVREYYYFLSKKIDNDDIISRVNELGVEKAFSFSILYSSILYNDNNLIKLLERINYSKYNFQEVYTQNNEINKIKLNSVSESILLVK